MFQVYMSKSVSVDYNREILVTDRLRFLSPTLLPCCQFFRHSLILLAISTLQTVHCHTGIFLLFLFFLQHIPDFGLRNWTSSLSMNDNLFSRCVICLFAFPFVLFTLLNVLNSRFLDPLSRPIPCLPPFRTPFK